MFPLPGEGSAAYKKGTPDMAWGAILSWSGELERFES